MSLANIEIETEMIINEFLKTTDNAGKMRLLHVGKETVKFIYINNKEFVDERVLNIGYLRIITSYLKRPIPKEDEIENAINHIEDELMRFKELVNEGEELFTRNEILIDILKSHKGEETEYSRQKIEDLFTQYVLLSMGQAPVYNKLEMNHEQYAVVLVLREIMHHLNFGTIHIVNKQAD